MAYILTDDEEQVEQPQVLRTGIFDCQVCVPAIWTDTEVESFANNENPAGTEQGWVIRRTGDKALNGDPERNECRNRVGFVHVVLDC